MPKPDSAAITAALDPWRQGDVTYDIKFTAYLKDARHDEETAPDVDGAGGDDSDKYSVAFERCEGLVVLTQTCDIIKSPEKYGYIEVCPLVRVSDGTLQEMLHWGHPTFLLIPTLINEKLVGDMSLVTSMEKSSFVGVTRVAGSMNDAQAQQISLALERSVGRFAFPDDFAPVAKKFRKHLLKKWKDEDEEGECVDCIKEVRVATDKEWYSDEPKNLNFYFVIRAVSPAVKALIIKWVHHWMTKMSFTGKYVLGEVAVLTFAEMSVEKFQESSKLDLAELNSPDGFGEQDNATPIPAAAVAALAASNDESDMKC